MEDYNEESRKVGKNLRDTISSFIANEEILVESVDALSKMLGERRDALMKYGFTREEALQIITHRGLE